jgi:tetratricopeptide (TPR) repeat protein
MSVPEQPFAAALIIVLVFAGCRRTEKPAVTVTTTKSLTPTSQPSDPTRPAFWLARADADLTTLSPSELIGGSFTLANEYAVAGDAARFRALVARVEQISPYVEPKFRPNLPADLAAAYAALGDRANFDRAVAALYIPDANPYSRSDVIRKLVRFGLLDDAAALAVRQVPGSERASRLSYIAPVLAKAGKKDQYESAMRLDETDTAAAIAADKNESGKQMLADDLVYAQLLAGDFARAEKSVELLKPGTAASRLAELADARRRTGDTAGYQRDIDEALIKAMAEPSSVYQQSGYQTIGKTLADAGDEGRMRQACSHSSAARDNLPAEYDYERARLAAASGDVDQAIKLLKQADGADAKDDDIQKAMRIKGIQHWRVIEALIGAGRGDAALAMAAHPPDVFPGHPPTPVEAAQRIAKAQAKAGRWAAARATMDKVLAVEDPQESALIPVISAAARAGEPVAELRAWVDTIQNPVWRFNADVKVAEAVLNRAGRLHDQPEA